MRPQPQNQQDLKVKVDCHHQAILIALEIENHPLAGNNTGGPELLFQLRRTFPICPFRFGKPGIQLLLDPSSQVRLNTVFHKSVKRRSGNHSHESILPCSHYGSNSISSTIRQCPNHKSPHRASLDRGLLHSQPAPTAPPATPANSPPAPPANPGNPESRSPHASP